MVNWDYWHRIEYRREIDAETRVLEYTEVVQDQGWGFEHRAQHRQEWFVRYTRACAEDFLDRVRATPGTWVVAVWRNGEPLGSIRMKRAKGTKEHTCV
ncbi:hypothetical protein [Amycolatopsis anabasis]|uniref:hypothetical protein n=1 Tax=Amycolatopsis anabasis TaxID=1840409 RepID=UPI00131ACC5F|nr:hypothetical protein [Amycolatopsis anabasis]